MPKRTFDGPVPEVDLVLASGVVRVKRGDPVEVTDDEAANLDAQGGWLGGPAKAGPTKTDLSPDPQDKLNPPVIDPKPADPAEQPAPDAEPTIPKE